MSYFDKDVDGTVEQPSQSQFANLLSLPYELVQSILASITSFEPWTYSSAPEHASACLTDEELELYTRDSIPLNLTSINQLNLGLWSRHDWLLLLLSRHPYCLTRGEKGGISSAVTQALRRENARRERTYWERRGSRPILQVLKDVYSTNRCQPADKGLFIASNDFLGHRMSAPYRMTQYHACVEPEEASDTGEKPVLRRSSQPLDSSATALIVYDPAPVLKLTQHDISDFANQSLESLGSSQMTALLAAVLITLLHCRLSLKENLEKLERDTPIPSIEADETQNFATPKMSPRPDRHRSLSGSTVADVHSHEETLSFSVISTVYSSHKEAKEVRWAEKRVSEEREVDGSPKRPKLNEYKQVSSGRVATLMDRFEKFHL